MNPWIPTPSELLPRTRTLGRHRHRRLHGKRRHRRSKLRGRTLVPVLNQRNTTPTSITGTSTATSNWRNRSSEARGSGCYQLTPGVPLAS